MIIFYGMAAIVRLLASASLALSIFHGHTAADTNNGYLSHTSFSDADAMDASGACNSRVLIYGYPCQEYSVTTEDGYILSLQRIPFGQSYTDDRAWDRQPVLLHHGILSDGSVWLLNSPDQSLAFILADNGFDVWIVNGRGTKWSRKHQYLLPFDSVYWQWSWDELAAYDLPASLEFVYRVTGKQISYIGHSEGTLIALAAFSEGRLLDIVKSAALLSPIAHLDHNTALFATLAADLFMAEAIGAMGVVEFDPGGPVAECFLGCLCTAFGMNCFELVTPFTGENCCLNSSRADVYSKNKLQPTSTLNLVHYSQMIRTGTISKFDYGQNNIYRYNQMQPPAYDLSNISATLPLFIGHGGKDALSDPEDVELLLMDLRSHNSSVISVLYLPDYAHLDFIMGVSANEQLYQPLISFINNH